MKYRENERGMWIKKYIMNDIKEERGEKKR